MRQGQENARFLSRVMTHMIKKLGFRGSCSLKTTMNKSLRASVIAVAIASIPLGAHAAGLGQINVFSGLGQPLRAEIQVSATAQELQSLTARIASPEAFRQANVNYSSAVSAIRVSVDTRASRPVIRLSSDRPINDPFVDLLVELNWANGRMAREYTFLLDPVDLAAPRPLAAAVDAPATPAARPLTPAVRPAAQAGTSAVPDSYTVRRGDTLGRIAGASTHPGVTLDQMLVALYRANPGAFDGGNINRLRAGSVLKVPSADEALKITTAEARREIRAQSADFEAYRRSLATASAERAPVVSEEAQQESAGQIVPKVEEPAPAAEKADQVKVSRSQAAGAAGGEADVRLQALEEELAAREKALEEANTRLMQLEQSVRDMQKLLELRSGTLAQLQESAGAPAVREGAEPAPVAAASQEAPATPVAADSPAAVEPQATAPASEAPAEQAQPAPQVAQEEAKPAPKRPPVRRPPPEPVPEPSLVDSMMSDPTVVAGGAGILALLLGYVGFKLRGRRKAAPDASGGEQVGDLAPSGPGVFSATGGQSVDTGASSIIQTDFSQSGLSAIDADEGVDPVAEADVYMAYGRDAQAEEILQDALKADPSRLAIYLKLLEIYSLRKSAREFETVATELFARTSGQGREWEKAATMGRKLDADNPLYAEQGLADESIAPRTEVPAGIAPAAAVGLAAAGVASAVTPPLAAEAAPQAAEEGGSVENLDEAKPAASLSSLDFSSSGLVEPSQSQMRDTWTVPGDLRQFAGDKPDGTAPDVEELSAAIAAGADLAAPTDELESVDTGALDFELDLGEGVQDALADVPTAEEGLGAEPTGGDGGLAFDLDLGEAEAPAVPAALDVAQPQVAGFDSTAATIVAGDDNLAAALDFELPDLDVGVTAPSPDMSATVLQGDALLQSEMEESVTSPSVAAKAPEAVVDLEKTSFDSSLLDFDFDIDTPVQPAAAAPSGLDLAGIDLDLDSLDAPAEADDAEAQSMEATQLGELGPQGGFDEVPASTGDEVDTKLELARAYDDMGDKEGALELLEEVVRDGSAEQQAAARDMIARLS